MKKEGKEGEKKKKELQLINVFVFSKVTDYKVNTKYQPNFYILAVLSRVMAFKRCPRHNLWNLQMLFYIEKKTLQM